MVIGDMPKELYLKRDHDHDIQLVPSRQPPNIMPYGYPYIQKMTNIIEHSETAYSSQW